MTTIGGADPRIAQTTSLLDEGLGLLAAARPRKAVRPLEKAFRLARDLRSDVLAELHLRRRVARALLEALRSSERDAEIERRAAEFLRAGVADAAIAERVIHQLAIEEKRTDVDALDLYVAAVECGAPLSAAARERLNQVLAYALHVRLTSTEDEVRSFIPFLERLNRARPRLTFARLYLGRYHYLRQDFGTARTYLAGIDGRLASSPKVLNVRARCAEKLALADEALSLYRQSLAEDFHQPHVHFRIGRILIERAKAAIRGGG